MPLTLKKKKHLTYITIGIFFLLQGVEYAVILPTLWLYIDHKFHGRAYMLGIVLSAFSFSGLLSSPLMGRWSDRTRNTKAILLVANVIQFIGSVMYFMGINEWFLVAARFVAGLGSGVGSALFGDISRVTSTEERTAVMSVFMAVRQIGLLLGPGCNLFLRQLHFSIGPYVVDKYTAPGIFMAFLWVLHEVLTLFMFWNLPKLKLEEMVVKQQQESIAHSSHSRLMAASQLPSMESPLDRPMPNFSEASQNSHEPARVASPRSAFRRNQHSVASDLDDDPAYLTSSNEIIEGAERFMGDSERTTESLDKNNISSYNSNKGDRYQNMPASYGATSHTRGGDISSESSLGDSFRHMSHVDTDNLQQNPMEQTPEDGDQSVEESHDFYDTNQKLTLTFLFNEFVREEVIAILFTGFVAFFNQLGIETLFTPLSQKLLGWGELENSLLYCGAGAEVIAVFFLVRHMSKRLGDRWLLLIGFVILTITIAASTWFLPQAKPGNNKTNLPALVVLVFFDVFSLPFLAVPSASLFSKITRRETQGFAQGSRQLVIGIATILGPLWSASLVSQLTVNLSVMLAVNCLGMVMLLLSFKHMKEKREISKEIDKRKHKFSREPHNNSVTVQPWQETEEANERTPLVHASS